jgi:apolipoprotein N-acyltransferase
MYSPVKNRESQQNQKAQSGMKLKRHKRRSGKPPAVDDHVMSEAHSSIEDQSALAKILLVFALLAAGAMQTLSLAPFNFWVLGPLSIALVLMLTRALNAPSSAFKGFFYGWIFGIGLFGSGASWVYVSINTYGYAPPFLAGSLTLVFVLGLALFSGLSLYLYGKLKTASKVGNALLFTACWVLGDLFRGTFLTGFPWLYLGYAHLNTPLAGWIPITGVHGITAMVVASGIALYFLLILLFKALPILIKHNATSRKRAFRSDYHPRKTLLKASFIVTVMVLWLSGPTLSTMNWTNISEQPIDVALIQTNIPQEEKWKPEQRLKTLDLLEEMSTTSHDSDIIVWPETAIPILYDQAQPFLSKISEQAMQTQTSIISGLPFRQIQTDGSRILHNSIISFGSGEGIYHKQKLVPFGEYVPLQDILRGLIAFFDLPMSDFRTGAADQAPLTSLSYKVAPFICYEVVYPDFVSEAARGTDFLLTISNDSWFGASIGPLQHLEMAQMRAAETRRYMIRGTNNGVSAVIDQHGQILARSEQFVRTTLKARIYPATGDTPFMQTGSWPVGLVSALILLIALLQRKHSHKAAVATA